MPILVAAALPKFLAAIGPRSAYSEEQEPDALDPAMCGYDHMSGDDYDRTLNFIGVPKTRASPDGAAAALRPAWRTVTQGNRFVVIVLRRIVKKVQLRSGCPSRLQGC